MRCPCPRISHYRAAHVAYSSAHKKEGALPTDGSATQPVRMRRWRTAGSTGGVHAIPGAQRPPPPHPIPKRPMTQNAHRGP